MLTFLDVDFLPNNKRHCIRFQKYGVSRQNHCILFHICYILFAFQRNKNAESSKVQMEPAIVNHFRYDFLIFNHSTSKLKDNDFTIMCNKL